MQKLHKENVSLILKRWSEKQNYFFYNKYHANDDNVKDTDRIKYRFDVEYVINTKSYKVNNIGYNLVSIVHIMQSFSY